MRLPDHIAVLYALRRGGTPLHLAMTGAEIPVVLGRQLVLIGDDPAEGSGRGPDGWNSPALRALLRGLKPGAVGVFAGAPVVAAYEALCFSAAKLSGGAVIIECSAAQFGEWFTYTRKHAVFAARFDVAPAGWQPSADTIMVRGLR